MKFLISTAHAASEVAPAAAAATPPPAGGGLNTLFMMAAMAVMFYVLLIMPQQSRFKKHAEMLRGLKKGDKVLTGAGFIGVIDTIEEGNDEVIIDLGGMKVTALRSSIQNMATKPSDKKKSK